MSLAPAIAAVAEFPHWVSPCGTVLLVNADCLKVLPLLPGGCVDAVVTDPVWPNVPEGLLVGWERPFDLFRETLSVITADRVVVLLGFDSDPRFLCAVPSRWPFIRSQQMPYAVPSYRGRLLGGDEMAYAFGAIPKGRGVIPGRLTTVATYKRDRATGHPCPRADEHLRDVVKWWTAPRDVVLDPFCGTGSTSIGCAYHHRQFIGIEIDPDYYEIAINRVKDAMGMEVPTKSGVVQRRMFSPEVSQ